MQRIPLDHPIIVIGAGGIVRDAHLPAYSKAGFRLAGIYDLEVQKAKTLADQYGIPTPKTRSLAWWPTRATAASAWCRSSTSPAIPRHGWLGIRNWGPTRDRM